MIKIYIDPITAIEDMKGQYKEVSKIGGPVTQGILFSLLYFPSFFPFLFLTSFSYSIFLCSTIPWPVPQGCGHRKGYDMKFITSKTKMMGTPFM